MQGANCGCPVDTGVEHVDNQMLENNANEKQNTHPQNKTNKQKKKKHTKKRDLFLTTMSAVCLPTILASDHQ